MSRRPPVFFLIGAPKAGTSALHAALNLHPQLFLSPVKEPKYYLCGGFATVVGVHQVAGSLENWRAPRGAGRPPVI